MMDQNSNLDRLLAGAKESAPEDLLERLEQVAHRQYGGQRRLPSVARGLTGACLAAAAGLLLVWSQRPTDELSIHAEKLVVGPKLAFEQDSESVPPSAADSESEPKAAPSAKVFTKARPALPEKVTQPALSQELGVLARVRQALREGNAKQALQVLDQHGPELQLGQLRLEAEVLRLEALSKLDAKDEASKRAQRFIQENPNSPLVDRVRGYVEEQR